MASDLPVGVFSAGNDQDTFSFAKGFFYPSFLSLEEEEMVIRPKPLSEFMLSVVELICHLRIGPSELTLQPPPPSWAAALVGLGLSAPPSAAPGTGL